MHKTIYKISNGTLSAEIGSFGAQLCSLKDVNGKEYIWEANPDIWPKSAPIMFPICGGLKEDAFYHGGKRYDLPKHGFGCSYDYTLVEQTDSSVALKIVSTDETRAMYPFDFEFIVKFELIGGSLKVTYTTVNTGTEALYHAPGGHEGYALPEGIEEYDVVFDEYENLERTEAVLKERLSAHYDREIGAGATLYGTHKDDVEVLLNGKPARSFCSQGQQRSLALALKIAEGELCKRDCGEYPVLLFDDVLSELDRGRRDYLLRHIKGKQVIMTTCEGEGLTAEHLITVKNGTYEMAEQR